MNIIDGAQFSQGVQRGLAKSRDVEGPATVASFEAAALPYLSALKTKFIKLCSIEVEQA